jgi:hypothetical protein
VRKIKSRSARQPRINVKRAEEGKPKIGIKCFHCKSLIKDNEDYFGIFRNSHRGANLSFHVTCFVSVAGEDYAKQLDYAAAECRKCGSSTAPAGRILCGSCNNSITPCEKCGSPMRPRINSNNMSAFLGCSNYPNCKHTRRL